jgi:hypothetical protein
LSGYGLLAWLTVRSLKKEAGCTGWAFLKFVFICLFKNKFQQYQRSASGQIIINPAQSKRIIRAGPKACMKAEAYQSKLSLNSTL